MSSETEPLQLFRVALPVLGHLDVEVEEDLLPEQRLDALARGRADLAQPGAAAADDDGRIGVSDFVAQFDAALAKVIAVVESAGGEPRHITRLTIYVTDIDVYTQHRAALGLVWKKRMAGHYPAMALIGVTALVDRDATVEIEADAILPPPEASR